MDIIIFYQGFYCHGPTLGASEFVLYYINISCPLFGVSICSTSNTMSVNTNKCMCIIPLPFFAPAFIMCLSLCLCHVCLCMCCGGNDLVM